MKPVKGITIRRDLIPELRKALAAVEKQDKADNGALKDQSGQE